MRCVVYTVLCTVLSIAMNGVVAEPLSYNYVYASRVESEFNGQDTEGDTLGLFAELNDDWHLTLSQGDAGWGSAGAKQTTRRLGLGGRRLFNGTTVVAPTLSLLDIDTETPDGNDDERAWSLVVDLRHILYEKLELISAVRYLDLDAGSQSGGEVGLMFHFSEWLAIGGIARQEDGVNATEWTARLYW